MNDPGPGADADFGHPRTFATTHWSVVLAARDGDSPSADDALQELCRAYWYPLYAFVRRLGHAPEDARDLTQEFFAQLLGKNQLRHLSHREGRFRSFLLTLLQHFLANERRKARAAKRGGGEPPLPLDELDPEDRYRFEPVDSLTPEKAFDRHWARTVIERSQARLRADYEAAGRLALFDRLKSLQPGDRDPSSYAVLAAELGMSEGAVKVAVHRLRQRHRDMLRAEIAGTVADPAEVQEEVRHLLAALEG